MTFVIGLFKRECTNLTITKTLTVLAGIRIFRKIECYFHATIILCTVLHNWLRELVAQSVRASAPALCRAECHWFESQTYPVIFIKSWNWSLGLRR